MALIVRTITHITDSDSPVDVLVSDNDVRIRTSTRTWDFTSDPAAVLSELSTEMTALKALVEAVPVGNRVDKYDADLPPPVVDTRTMIDSCAILRLHDTALVTAWVDNERAADFPLASLTATIGIWDRALTEWNARRA